MIAIINVRLWRSSLTTELNCWLLIPFSIMKWMYFWLETFLFPAIKNLDKIDNKRKTFCYSLVNVVLQYFVSTSAITPHSTPYSCLPSIFTTKWHLYPLLCLHIKESLNHYSKNFYSLSAIPMDILTLLTFYVVTAMRLLNVLFKKKKKRLLNVIDSTWN